MSTLDAPDSTSLMEFGNAYRWMKWQAESIGRLVLQGDKMAIEVEAAYRAWYVSRLDPRLQENFIKAVYQYALREHEIAARVDLANKFGHKLPEKFQ